MKSVKIFLLSFLIVLSACTSTNSVGQEPEIEFSARIQTTFDNEMEISLQIYSPKSDFDADPEFDASMKLLDPSGELRAEAALPQNPFMKRGELYQLITWRGFLEPGEYKLEWSAPTFGGTQITFEVVEQSSGNYLIGAQKIETLSTTKK
ncbi:MAG TPA: hypothetical protein VK856_15280 [Anaerolineaceae bacterium]|nr:hypothetical protein [Anaerolineaceae bacterium]